MIPFVLAGGSHDIEAPSTVLLIFMADGAPGKPGRQVLKADTSEKGPRPHSLMAATRNLYAVPGSKSTFFKLAFWTK